MFNNIAFTNGQISYTRWSMNRRINMFIIFSITDFIIITNYSLSITILNSIIITYNSDIFTII